MTRRFVDTSAWYSAMDSADRNHRAATARLAEGGRFVLTDHVLVETWRLAAHRLGWHVAEQFFGTIRRGAAHVEGVTPADREHAWATGMAFSDQGWSLADRTSFAVMERLGLHTVVTFDDDFAIYRFGRDRGLAFTVQR
ncbi:type II toxin-antitoxin system VapC family toxin [Euzebya tangerina]|uniref:type II toxin-antitoxin system VapC family toxin n=1 Tax=Euzebya tangerina TaxID=591198 RepID=UPI000E315D17|nr:PIN domain-containing protein [Euzebya tangerina]